MPGLSLGLSPFMKPINWAAYSAEYQTVYDSFTTPPSAAIATEQNRMVVALVAAGVWAKLDLFYLFAQETNDDGEAQTNWINPGTFDATIVLNGGTMNFTAFEGFQSNDGAYLDSNYNPLINKINLSLNDCAIGSYVRNNPAAETTILIGVYQTSNNDEMQLSPYYDIAGNKYYFARMVGGNGISIVNADGRGMSIVQRTADNAIAGYLNNGTMGTDTDASVSLPNANMFILARNRIGGGAQLNSKYQVSNSFIGASLSLAQRTAFTNALETYMDSNSKGVIT